MATKEALLKLQKLISLIENTDKQLDNIAKAMKQTRAEIDNILEDKDVNRSEILAESTTGTEESFSLLNAPVKQGTVSVFIDGTLVDSSNYDVDYQSGSITPAVAIPKGKTLTVEYTSLGMLSLVVSLLDVMPDVDKKYFTDKYANYQTAIDWIESR